MTMANQYYTSKDSQEKAKELAQEIVASFCSLTDDAAEKASEEINDQLQRVINTIVGYTTHFETEFSPTELFISIMEKILCALGREATFSCSRAFEMITQTTANLYLHHERKRKFPFIEDFGWGDTVWTSSTSHIAKAEMRVANYFASLGQIEQALEYRRHALHTAGSWYRDSVIAEQGRKLRQLVSEK